MKEFDVVIIGSGISGMTAYIYLKRSGINPLIIESSAPGGAMNKITVIENYPGYVSIDGPTLAYNIYEQVNSLGANYLFDTVMDIEKINDDIIVKTKKEEIKTKYVIIATGRSERKLGIPNENELLGKGISYCALCDGALYKDKEVAVIGGGSSALEEAIHLAKICKKVTLIHRRNAFTGEQKLIDEVVVNKKIKIIYDSAVTSINEKDGRIDSIILNEKKKIKLDGLFICIGYVPTNNFSEYLRKDNNYLIVNEKMETSIKNIYAIGDSIKKDYYQLIGAANDALVVAKEIINDIK